MDKVRSWLRLGKRNPRNSSVIHVAQEPTRTASHRELLDATQHDYSTLEPKKKRFRTPPILCCSTNKRVAWTCRAFLLVFLALCGFMISVVVRLWPLRSCTNCVVMNRVGVSNMTTNIWSISADAAVDFPSNFRVSVGHTTIGVDKRHGNKENALSASVKPVFSKGANPNTKNTQLNKGKWNMFSSGSLEIKDEALVAEIASSMINQEPIYLSVTISARVSTPEFGIPVSFPLSLTRPYQCNTIPPPFAVQNASLIDDMSVYHCGWDEDFVGENARQIWQLEHWKQSDAENTQLLGIQMHYQANQSVVVEGHNEPPFQVLVNFTRHLPNSFVTVETPPLYVYVYGDHSPDPAVMVHAAPMRISGDLLVGGQGNNLTATVCVPAPVTTTTVEQLQQIFSIMYQGNGTTVHTYPRVNGQATSLPICGPEMKPSVAQNILNLVRVSLPLAPLNNTTPEQQQGSAPPPPPFSLERLDLLGFNRTNVLLHANFSFDASKLLLGPSQIPPLAVGMFLPNETPVSSVFAPTFSTSGGESSEFGDLAIVGFSEDSKVLKRALTADKLHVRALRGVNLLCSVLSATDLFVLDPKTVDTKLKDGNNHNNKGLSDTTNSTSDSLVIPNVEVKVYVNSTASSLRAEVWLNMTKLLLHAGEVPTALDNSRFAIGGSEFGIFTDEKRAARVISPAFAISTTSDHTLQSELTSPFAGSTMEHGDGMVGIVLEVTAEDSDALRRFVDKLQNGAPVNISKIVGTLDKPDNYDGPVDADADFDVLSVANRLLPVESIRHALEIAGYVLHTNAWNSSQVVDKVKNSFDVSDVHVVGGGEGEGSPIVMPCIFEGLCPREDSKVPPTWVSSLDNRTSQALVFVDFSIGHVDWPEWFSIEIDMPSLLFQLDCCTTKPVTTTSIRAKSVTPSLEEDGSAQIRVELLTTVVNVPLVRTIANDWLGSMELPFTLHPQVPAPSLLSSLITTSYSFDLPKSTPLPPSPETNATSVAAEFLPLRSSNSWHLNSTSDNHVTWWVKPPGLNIPWSLAAPLRLGLLSADVIYRGIPFVHIGMDTADGDFVLWPNRNNTFGMMLTLHGMANSAGIPPDVLADCDGIPDMRKCLMMALFHRLLLSEKTEASVVISFNNTLNRQQLIELNMLWLEDVQVQYNRDYVIPTTNDYMFINGMEANIKDTIFSSATFWDGINAVCHFLLRNNYNFDLRIWQVSVDILYSDPNGFEEWYYPTTYPPADNLLLTRGMSLDANAEGGLLLPSGQFLWSKDVVIAINKDKAETLARLYDEVYINNRLCSQLVNGYMVVELRHGTDQPFILNQKFAILNYPLIGFTDCFKPTNCTEEVVPRLSYTSFTTDNTAQLMARDSSGPKSPATSGGRLILTNGRSQQISVWFTPEQPVVDSFESRFEFSAQSLSFTPDSADGFAFVIQASGTNAFGGSCSTGSSCYGYKGISNSVAVVFNLYLGSSVTVFKNGDLGTQIANSGIYGTMDDGAHHYVLIRYEALPKRLDVYMQRGSPITTLPEHPLISCEMSLPDVAPGGMMWAGFTASTGTVFAAGMTIGSFSYGGSATSVALSHIDEEGGLIGRVGDVGVFHIDSRTSCGAPRLTGGDVWSLYLNSTVSGLVHDIPTHNVTDSGGGRYVVSSLLPFAGTVSVWGSINNILPAVQFGFVRVQ